MAPESERACTKCGHPRNAHDLEQPYECFHLPGGAFEYSCDCDGFSYAPEPTLTCSEVVERLATECVNQRLYPNLNREKATAILHAWRERRVQELEELLAKQSGCSHCNDSASGSTSANDSTETRESK